MSWKTRLKAVWDILVHGNLINAPYRTKHAEKQFELCQQRQREMDACIRPRTETYEHESSNKSNRQ